MIIFLLLVMAHCMYINCTYKSNMEVALVGYNPAIGNGYADGQSDPGMRSQIFVAKTKNQNSEQVLASNINVFDSENCEVDGEISVVNNYHQYKRKKLSHVTTTDESGFSVSVKVPYVEASYKQGSSDKASKEYEIETSFFSETSGQIYIEEAYCEVYKVEVSPFEKPIFESAFIIAMQALNKAAKKPNSRSSKQILRMFIETYGTHYQSESWLGASLTTEVRSASQSKGADETQKRSDCITEAHTKAFSVGVNGGEFSIEAELSLSKELDKCLSKDNDNKFVTKNDFKKTKFISRGSLPIQDLDKWLSVIKESPSVMRLNIKPITNLFTSDWIGKIPATNDAGVKEYLDVDRMYNYFNNAVENYCETMLGKKCTTPKGCGINSNCTYLERCENDNSTLGFKCLSKVTMLVGGYREVRSEVLGHPSCRSINLPHENNAFVTVTSGSTSLLCGGYAAGNTCYKLNLANRTWDIHSHMLYNRYWSSIVAISGRIYVFGGEGDKEIKKMEWLTIGGTKWIEGPNIARNGLYNGCALKINETHIAVIGGVGAENHGNKVIVFNIISQKWTSWNNLGHRLWGQACILTEQGILVSGGWSDDKEITNWTVLIDLATGNNRYVGPLNTPRRLFRLVRQNGIILAVGGDTPDGQTNTIEKWVPEAESWVPANIALSVARFSYGTIEVPYSDVCQ